MASWTPSMASSIAAAAAASASRSSGNPAEEEATREGGAGAGLGGRAPAAEAAAVGGGGWRASTAAGGRAARGASCRCNMATNCRACGSGASVPSNRAYVLTTIIFMCSRLTTMALGLMKTLLGYAVGRFGSRIMRSRKGTPSSRCISALVASRKEALPEASTRSQRRARE